ncbi:hypothetical protein TOPH_03363, partial [Tolypocladium ophioglossoides CBS 100239]
RGCGRLKVENLFWRRVRSTLPPQQLPIDHPDPRIDARYKAPPPATCTMAHRTTPAVRFSDAVGVQSLESQYPQRRGEAHNARMAKQMTELFECGQVTEDMLEHAAQLFSENYGIWGQPPPSGRSSGKPGNRVKMSASRLRAQCLPAGSRSSYARVTVDGVLAGNAFACRWRYKGRQVFWVTQLVVHRDYRERRLATTLLLALLENDDDIFGIMSSHPAACKALAKAFGNFVFPHVPLDFARQHAADVMAGSPVSYIKGAKLCGSLFHPGDTTGLRCGVDSDFFVDHTEPLEALAWFKEMGEWPLGDLPDGHEFLLLFELARRRRSRPLQRAGQEKSQAS